MTSKRAVYFFCSDPEKDPVASRIFDISVQLLGLKETSTAIDDYPVLECEDAKGNVFQYVRTAEVLSHDYDRYIPILKEYFDGVDFAGLVNWHAGANAPDAILTVHTTGDAASGNFGTAEPRLTRNLLLAIDDNRLKLGLDKFTTVTEGTHWSGVLYGGSPELIPQYRAPLVDIEIGSSPASWKDATAAKAIAQALPEIFERDDPDSRSLLCVGGVHLEQAFANAVLTTRSECPLAVSHILPNQWIVAGDYDSETGFAKLEACVSSIIGGIQGIAFHDNLKGAYKAVLRRLAEKLDIPLFKHQALRQPKSLPLW